jgi:hypothetical protein
MINITPDELRKLLSYDPETGLLRWRVDMARNVFAGDTAGKVGKSKYLKVCVRRKYMLAHRVAWAITYGVWPSNLIDHKNNDPHDNRLSNLREATYSQNSANRPTPRTGRSGVKGVRRRKNRWEVNIETGGVSFCVGRFHCLGKAAAAYRVKARELFGEYASGGAR